MPIDDERAAPRRPTRAVVAATAMLAGTLALATGATLAARAAAPPEGAFASTFTPPPDSAIPDDGFGADVKLGKAIFTDTRAHAGAFVGNDLRCSNCHLDAGRLANAAPMAQAYVRYPAFRKKTGQVDTFEERLQGCFRYSMNGKPPPLGDKVLTALTAYSYFLAKGAPTGAEMPGRGYPIVAKPPLPRDYARGEKVFGEKCAACHGADGAGQKGADGAAVFPALWGPQSFNWGAGMESVANAAGFIKANMPLGQGWSLSDQEAWDVATFVDSHERPQDPRFVTDVATTRARFHDTPNSMYGQTVGGVVLGSKSPPPGRADAAASR